MKLKAHNSSRKLRGGYYTPRVISDFIVEWALNSEQHPLTVLEPSCGDGVFLESLLQTVQRPVSCTAIELLEEEAEIAKQRTFFNEQVQVITGDFFKEYRNHLSGRSFDLIIGNPPYIRYQYLAPEQREIQARILVDNGMRSNKLINAWVSFIVACIQLLGNNGKIGLVIPAELLQVAYAKELRLFLVDQLAKITVVTFNELVFPDVQQEVILLLGEKSDTEIEDENRIRVIEAQNSETLPNDFYNNKAEFKHVSHTEDKWTRYFLTNQEIDLVNKIQSDERFNQFCDIGDVDIGITTGNNKFFSVSKDTVKNYGLEDVSLPLIGRSAHAKGIYFTHEDWIDNVNDAKKLAQLVYFPNESSDEFPIGHKKYIDYGEKQNFHTGYKCRIRKHWYHIPSVWKPDAFFLRRNNGFPKFVLNDIGAVSTDTMHRIKFNESISRDKILLSYYNSITFAFTELEGRSYGGGVLEVLPGEVEKIMLPNIQDIDDNIARELLNLIDISIRENRDIEPVLDEVDRRVLVDFLGMSKDQTIMFRNIWKKLLNRRQGRK